MLDFLRHEFLGLNGIVNLSNLVFIAALSVRGVLPLRLLAITSSFIILPYYYFQQDPLWPPLFWNSVSILINSTRVVQLLLERRPVVLAEREATLYRLAFTSLDKREFLRLASLARWAVCLAGEVLLKEGHVADEAIVLISGEAEARLNGKVILRYRPGELIGDANTYSGTPVPVDVVACTPLCLVKWDIARLRAYLESRPQLRGRLLELEGVDLSHKLHALARA